MKEDEYSTANNSETLEQQKSSSWTPVGPTKDRSSGHSQLNLELYAGAIIKSEARPTGVQFKRSAKLFTVTGLTTKHAVCSITFIKLLYLYVPENNSFERSALSREQFCGTDSIKRESGTLISCFERIPFSEFISISVSELFLAMHQRKVSKFQLFFIVYPLVRSFMVEMTIKSENIDL